MPENAPGFTQASTNIPPYSLVGGPENIKLLFDEELDDRRTKRHYGERWEAITLLQQQNLVAFSHAVNMGSLLSAQAGVIETQSQVSPIRTGAADAQNQQPAGAVYPPIRNVDQGGAAAQSAIYAGIAESVQTNVTSQIGTLTTQVVALAQQITDSNAAIAALLAQLVANSKQTTTPTAGA